MKKGTVRDDRKAGLTLTIGAVALSITTGGLVPVQAQPLQKETVLPLALAQQAAAAGLATCERDGYRVSVAVADRGGNLKVAGTRRWCGASYHGQ